MPESSAHPDAYLHELRKRLALHQKWVSGRGGRQADLSFYDLTGLPLTRVVLRNAKLIGATLSGSNLALADLQAAILLMAELEGVVLDGANLLGADLRGANLNGASLAEANLSGADLRTGVLGAVSTTNPYGGRDPAWSRNTRMVDARLSRALLVGSRLENCDLTGAELADADLSGADLSGAILIATDLSGVALKNTRLDGAVLSGAHLDESARAILADKGIDPRASLAPIAHRLPDLVATHRRWLDTGGREGSRLELDRADLVGAVLCEADLSGARILRSDLGGADLSGAVLTMADLSHCRLAGADLSGANLSGCSLRRADLTGARLEDAILDEVAITGSQARPWPTNLHGARLVDADLRCKSARGALLRFADLTGARLNMALFRGGANTEGARMPRAMADGPSP